MNKEKAIEFVLKNLGISSFDDLSISYDKLLEFITNIDNVDKDII